MKKLEIVERPAKDAIVFAVIGELTVSSGTGQLLDKVRTHVEAGHRLLLINMSQCQRVDSTGLGELVTCLVTSAKRDANLRLVGVPQQILGLMKIANVHQIFEIFAAEEAALTQPV